MIPRLRHLPVLALCALLAGCGAPRVDLDAWRAAESVARPAPERGALAEDVASVETLRAADELEASRRLALALFAEHPGDGRLAFLASRAESDGLVLFADREKHVRNAAAASALDHAERAEKLGETSVEARAQLAWALGAATHLQSMGARAAHARRTLEVARAALERDPADSTAHATIAVVHLRLQTLPWIANVMASGLPDSSLDEAVQHARRAVEARPSRENRLILARCLAASGEEGAARVTLDEALQAPPAYPRDAALEDNLRSELERL